MRCSSARSARLRAGAPPLAPAVYAQLAQAMAERAARRRRRASPAARRAQRVPLGLAASHEHLVVRRRVAAEHRLPERRRGRSTPMRQGVSAQPELDPSAVLEHALDARGACGRRAHIWVTEAGAGAPHPGRARAAEAQDEHAGCVALAAQLQRWVDRPARRRDPAVQLPRGSGISRRADQRRPRARLSRLSPVAALHARERARRKRRRRSRRSARRLTPWRSFPSRCARLHLRACETTCACARSPSVSG